jgi:hypothetical protein
MARGSKHEQQQRRDAAAAASAGDAPLPRGALVDRGTGDVMVPLVPATEAEQELRGGASSDSVEDALGGNYSPDIVDEVGWPRPRVCRVRSRACLGGV